MTLTAQQVVEAHAPLVGTGALPGVSKISEDGLLVALYLGSAYKYALCPSIADAYLLHLEAAACAEHDWVVWKSRERGWRRAGDEIGVSDCASYRDGILANAIDRFLPKPEAKVEAPRPVVVIDGVRYVPEGAQS